MLLTLMSNLGMFGGNVPPPPPPPPSTDSSTPALKIEEMGAYNERINKDEEEIILLISTWLINYN